MAEKRAHLPRVAVIAAMEKETLPLFGELEGAEETQIL